MCMFLKVNLVRYNITKAVIYIVINHISHLKVKLYYLECNGTLTKGNLVITILMCQDTFKDYKCITESLNPFHEKMDLQQIC
jgi:hypothetical protein